MVNTNQSAEQGKKDVFDASIMICGFVKAELCINIAQAPLIKKCEELEKELTKYKVSMPDAVKFIDKYNQLEKQNKFLKEFIFVSKIMFEEKNEKFEDLYLEVCREINAMRQSDSKTISGRRNPIQNSISDSQDGTNREK